MARPGKTLATKPEYDTRNPHSRREQTLGCLDIHTYVWAYIPTPIINILINTKPKEPK